MRLPIDTTSVRFAAAGPSEPVLDYETRVPKLDENGVRDRLFNTPLLITIEEAADFLRLGRTTTYELVMRGEIPSVKIGRRRLVVRSGLSSYVERLSNAKGVR